MHVATFDTHKAVKQLVGQGVSQAQAEVFVDVVRQSRDADADSLVTKSELKAELAEMKADLIKWMFGGFLAVIGLLVAILFKLH